MWLALVGTVAAVTVVFHWYVTRPARHRPPTTRPPLTSDVGAQSCSQTLDKRTISFSSLSPHTEHCSATDDLETNESTIPTTYASAVDRTAPVSVGTDIRTDEDIGVKTCCSEQCSESVGNNSSVGPPSKTEEPVSYSSLIEAKRALIVIAHPDDECMFYAPTIIGLLRRGADIHLLCLSSGNYRRKGLQRKVELRHSCSVLGIPPSNITIIEHTKLPDDPTLLWNKSLIKDILLKYVEKLSIDVVITFDDYGVSGHINHIALFKACQHMYSKGMFPVGTQVFVLQSVNLVRKYAGMVDTIFSHVDGATHLFISGYWDIFRAQRAMLKYRSQLVWFRVLYILFSRYMIVNTLRRIAMEERYYKYSKTTCKEDWNGGRSGRAPVEMDYSNPARQNVGDRIEGANKPAPVRRKLSH